MRENIRYILPWLPVKNSAHHSVAAAACFALRAMSALGITLAVSFSLANLTLAAEEPAARSAENVDSRWLPWIGSWQLISDGVREADSIAKDNYLLEIRPGSDGSSITMKSYQGEKLLLETRIAPGGSRQPLEGSQCSGWYKYAWSDTGKRLLFESEAGCPSEAPRNISGISVITDDRDWIDIQLLRSGEDHAVSVRKYRTVSASESPNTGPGVIGEPRFPVGAGLSVDEVIELSRKIPSELLEAAILELQKPFKINSSALKRLSDAGVQSQVVDLMVALSFPDKFTVSRQRISPVSQANTGSSANYGPPYVWLPFGYWAINGPYSSWYWGVPIFWGWGWDVWAGGRPYRHYGGWSDYNGGRLVNGRGYSAGSRPGTARRPAQPRSQSGNSGSGSQGQPRSSPPPASRGGSSPPSSSSGSSGSQSGSSSSSASPSGYHSSGSSEGGQAKPRD